nr:MAG TPA: stabilization protein [Caudoviricetes sp.]
MGEIVLPFSTGLQLNTNKLISSSLTVAKLENLVPIEGELCAEPWFTPFAKTTLTDDVVIDGYFAWYSGLSKEYVFGIKINKSIYIVNSNDVDDEGILSLTKAGDLYSTNYEQTSVQQLYTDFQANATMQYAQWVFVQVATAFITKPGLPITQLVEGGEAGYTPIAIPATYKDEENKDKYLSAKYIIATNDRLFIGHCWEGDTYYPTRIHWSDINKPLDWAVSSTSEADYFDLGVNSLEITGLAYANAILYTFTKNSIWRSDYEGFENKFKTTKFTSSTGNVYHYGVITVNEVIYFIGKDNFYMINNVTLQPIGDAIWSWFRENKAATASDPIMAQYELVQKTITWIFPKNDPLSSTGVSRWGIKYNTETGQWSTRSMQQ